MAEAGFAMWVLGMGLCILAAPASAAERPRMFFDISITSGRSDRQDMVVDGTLPELPQGMAPIAVAEVKRDGGAGQETPVAFQYEPESRLISLLLKGRTPAGTTRRYRMTCSSQAAPGPSPAALVKVEDVAKYQGQAAWKIQTPAGTYVYHRKGAGFASLLDTEGNDWISFHPRGGSDGKYRGIPNLVHPEGYFHPGGDKCSSRLVSAGPIKVAIVSTAEQGRWVVRWDIYPRRAVLTVLKAPKAYWFLYEGTPGGKIDGRDDYSLRPDGKKLPASESWDLKLPVPGWVQFGDSKLRRAIFLYNHNAPSSHSSYWMMQKNMTVFGFGRTGLKKKLSTVPARFTIGLGHTDAKGSAEEAINAACLPVEVNITRADPSSGENQ